jgi:hypothetical protein
VRRQALMSDLQRAEQLDITAGQQTQGDQAPLTLGGDHVGGEVNYCRALVQAPEHSFS